MSTAYPRVKGSKVTGWTREWLWLRVPLWANHTYLYLACTQFTFPINADKLDPDHLSQEERQVYDHFVAWRPENEAQKRVGACPKTWLPHYDLIRLEVYLAMGKLSNLYTQGKA